MEGCLNSRVGWRFGLFYCKYNFIFRAAQKPLTAHQDHLFHTPGRIRFTAAGKYLMACFNCFFMYSLAVVRHFCRADRSCRPSMGDHHQFYRRGSDGIGFLRDCFLYFFNTLSVVLHLPRLDLPGDVHPLRRVHRQCL